MSQSRWFLIRWVRQWKAFIPPMACSTETRVPACCRLCLTCAAVSFGFGLFLDFFGLLCGRFILDFTP